MKKITVVIKNGRTEIDFHGFAGRECEKEEAALRAICAAMGVQFSEEERFLREEREMEVEREREKA